MKKIFIFTLALVLLTLLAFLFVQFRKKPEEKEKIDKTLHLEKVSDIKIMSIKQNGLPISDIQWSLFLKKLNYESLPISAMFYIRSNSVAGDSQAIKCRIEYKNIKIEKTLTDLELSDEGSFYRYSGSFLYNLSELKKTSTDNEIMEFVNVFPSNPEIRYTISFTQ